MNVAWIAETLVDVVLAVAAKAPLEPGKAVARVVGTVGPAGTLVAFCTVLTRIAGALVNIDITITSKVKARFRCTSIYCRHAYVVTGNHIAEH